MDFKQYHILFICLFYYSIWLNFIELFKYISLHSGHFAAVLDFLEYVSSKIII